MNPHNKPTSEFTHTVEFFTHDEVEKLFRIIPDANLSENMPTQGKVEKKMKGMLSKRVVMPPRIYFLLGFLGIMGMYSSSLLYTSI